MGVLSWRAAWKHLVSQLFMKEMVKNYFGLLKIKVKFLIN